MKRLFWAAALFVLGGLTLSCTTEDEQTPCELYCESMTDCYRTLDQPFSSSACRRECSDSVERYTSVGCRTRYYDLLECKTDLSCSDANSVSDICSREIDDLSRCVEQ